MTAPGSSPSPIDVPDYVAAARLAMSPMAWDYVSGASCDELTDAWNRSAYDHIRLRPRCLIDVSALDTTVQLLGDRLSHPILLAPTAYQKLAHADGEWGTLKGANASGAGWIVSTNANVRLEELAAGATVPLWFQVYVQPDRDFTASLIRRAEAAGYKALVVTVDTPVLGMRYREQRSGFTLPAHLERANLQGLSTAKGAQRPGEGQIYSATLDPSLTWESLAWIRSLTRLPIVLKGIMTGEDAARAVGAGVDGLIVSNHGGRNLDTVPATIEVLPEVVAAVQGRIPVLVDGGIRRGTDVLKALAFGATAVCIGRPYVYGLAVGGDAGVAHVVNLLKREFMAAMALTGHASLATIDRSVLWQPSAASRT